MLHGYCIRLSTDPDPPEGLAGVGGEPVTAILSRGLSMWVSPSSEIPPDAERLRQHERVVRSALRTATPLPLRFGTRFPDPAAAAHALEQRGDEFARMLHELEGHVEMGIRVSSAHGRREIGSPGGSGGAHAPARRQPSSGRAYLEERRRALEARASVRDEVERQLDAVEAALAAAGWRSARAILPGDPPTGSLAHLVRREELNSYRDRVSALQIDNPHLRIAVSGPWAPYSFVR